MDCLNGLLDHISLDPPSSIKLIGLQLILTYNWTSLSLHVKIYAFSTEIKEASINSD